MYVSSVRQNMFPPAIGEVGLGKQEQGNMRASLLATRRALDERFLFSRSVLFQAAYVVLLLL